MEKPADNRRGTRMMTKFFAQKLRDDDDDGSRAIDCQKVSDLRVCVRVVGRGDCAASSGNKMRAAHALKND